MRVIISDYLVSIFKAMVQRDLDRNLETCGVLGGKKTNDDWFVSHLILPEQHQTDVSCLLTDQGQAQLEEYLHGHELGQIGWIHTHPSQTAFLSSMDQHQHFSYQTLSQMQSP